MVFDPNDPDTKAALKAAADEAVEAATTGLGDKNKELLDDLKKAKADLRKVAEIKPEDVAALEADLEKARADLVTANKTAKDATTAADKATKALEAESGFTQKLLIQDGIKSALIAAGVKDEDHLDVLAAKYANGAKVIVEGEERKAMIGDKPIGDFFKEWSGTDTAKKYIQAPVNGGGGAGGGKTGEAAKTMDRKAFDGLDGLGKVAFAKEGGKVVDA